MKYKKGFTLIELVVTIALIGIVLPMIFSPIMFSLKSFHTQSEKTEIISDARVMMDYLTREIRRSDPDIVVTTTSNTITIDSVVYEIEDRELKKNGSHISGGIDKLTVDELNVNENDQEIEIEIVIKDSNGKRYSKSSIIYVR